MRSSPTQALAQAHLDAFCARVGDSRRRMWAGEATTVGALAEAEPLRPPPALPYPATVAVTRTVSAQALVSYRSNRYSVPPGLAGTTVQVAHRLGAATLDIAAGAVVLARHHREPDGAGAIVRDAGHVVALEKAVLAAFTAPAPCRAKVRRPPSAAALAEADRLRGARPAPGEHVVVDLTQYVAATTADRDAREQSRRRRPAMAPLRPR